MRYLTVDDVLRINRSVLYGDYEIGEEVFADLGLLDSAVMRPQQSAFGEDAYADIHMKAGALLHSLARNHAFVDGNKRTALLAVVMFYAMNGWLLTLDQGVAVSLPIDAAEGQVDVPTIASVLKNFATPMWPDGE